VPLLEVHPLVLLQAKPLMVPLPRALLLLKRSLLQALAIQMLLLVPLQVLSVVLPF